MNILILCSGLTVLEKIKCFLKEAARNNRVVIVTTREFYERIYKMLVSMNIGNVEIVLMGKRNVEERVLRIFVDSEPDVIIDCDDEDRLLPVKTFFKNTPQGLSKCSDLDAKQFK